MVSRAAAATAEATPEAALAACLAAVAKAAGLMEVAVRRGGRRLAVRAPAAGWPTGAPAVGGRLRPCDERPTSLRTVRRRAAPSAGGSGGAGGVAYLHKRLRQAGAERRGLALDAEVGRRLWWRLRA
jgi:hypothetical protein